LEEPFINNAIDTIQLPKFEEVQLMPLHPSYLKIIGFNIALVFVIIAIAISLGFYYIEELQPYRLLISASYIFVVLFATFINVISYKTRGFAFREHDVIYRSGAIAITTTIIPYNRVQHVAVHEGLLSRKLGLAAVEVFTAGGHASDIKIPGIEKEQAEKIKYLIMGKINVQPDEQ
jgi:membrane protein YdbS with pleckstrin-like domain